MYILLFVATSNNEPINVIPGVRGGDFDEALMPEGVALTLWTGPRVRIFDFSLSRGQAVLTIAYIPGRLGISCFVSRWQ